MQSGLRKTLGVLALLVGAMAAEGKWMKLDEPVPVERLRTNIGRYIEQHPKDARGYYVLGRVQSLVYAGGGQTVDVIPPGKRTPGTRPGDEGEAGAQLPGFAAYQSIEVRADAAQKLDEARRTALLGSIHNYRKAVELSPDQALYWLGLGWMLEQAAGHAEALTVGPDLKEVKPPAGAEVEQRRKAWEDEAVKAYRKAYDLTIAQDLKGGSHGPAADTLISLEAGQGLLRILEKRPDADAGQIAQVKKSIGELHRRPMAKTPIIFALDRAAPMENLIDSKAEVSFDLAGDGIKRVWPWVRPGTGILVWDPLRTGKITSGRQLFGSATWWMFWSNGYEALAALDDDGDGFLSGRELDGLAVWRDAGSDGQASSGEVVPARELGIERIGVVGTRARDGVWQSREGIWMRDGRRLPTYDWAPTSR